MAVRKRKVKVVTSSVRPKPKAVFVKPAGIRVEDLEYGTVFTFTMDDSKETHLALAHGYGVDRDSAQLSTWCLAGKESSPCVDLLPAQVTWDYKIEILGKVDAQDVAKKIIRACKRAPRKPLDVG